MNPLDRLSKGIAMQSPAAVIALKRLADASFRGSEDGQDLLEYALLVALIAMFAIGAVTLVGNVITTVFWTAIAATV